MRRKIRDDSLTVTLGNIHIAYNAMGDIPTNLLNINDGETEKSFQQEPTKNVPTDAAADVCIEERIYHG